MTEVNRLRTESYVNYIIEKLNQVQPISISVPAIPMPEINVGYTQVA